MTRMLEVGARTKSQPAPKWVLFEALSRPHRYPSRPWLKLLEDEVEPDVVEAVEPHLVIWSSLWTRRRDARVRFDLARDGSGCTLRWTLLVEEPEPEAALLGHLRTRLNQLVSANLRYSLGQ